MASLLFGSEHMPWVSDYGVARQCAQHLCAAAFDALCGLLWFIFMMDFTMAFSLTTFDDDINLKTAIGISLMVAVCYNDMFKTWLRFAMCLIASVWIRCKRTHCKANACRRIGNRRCKKHRRARARTPRIRVTRLIWGLVALMVIATVGLRSKADNQVCLCQVTPKQFQRTTPRAMTCRTSRAPVLVWLTMVVISLLCYVSCCRAIITSQPGSWPGVEFGLLAISSGVCLSKSVAWCLSRKHRNKLVHSLIGNGAASGSSTDQNPFKHSTHSSDQNPSEHSTPAADTFEKAQAAMENKEWNFETNAQFENLQRFCTLWCKSGQRGDVNQWRTLASKWGLPRTTLPGLKAACLNKFLSLVQKHLERLPAQNTAVKTMDRRPIPSETKNTPSQFAECSLLVKPGATFDQKLLVPSSCIVQLVDRGLIEPISIATALSKHFAWKPQVSQETQWKELLASLPPGSQKTSLEKQRSKNTLSSCSSQGIGASDTTVKRKSETLRPTDSPVTNNNPTTKPKRTGASNPEPEKKRKAENALQDGSAKRQTIMQLLLSQGKKVEEDLDIATENLDTCAVKKAAYWWKKNMFAEWNRVRALTDVHPQLKKRLFAAANHSTDKGLSKEIRDDALWWKTADLSSRLTTRTSRTRFVTEFLHYELSVAILSESMNVGNPGTGDTSLLPAMPMSKQDLAEAVRTNQNFLPFGCVSKLTSFVKPSASQFFRHLALIELPAYRYTDLPLDPKALHLLLCQNHDARCKEKTQTSTGTAHQMHVCAHLERYVEEPFNLHANKRFLCGNDGSKEKVKHVIQELVRDAFTFLQQNSVKPETIELLRLSALCVYYHRLVCASSVLKFAAWSPYFCQKKNYIPGSQIECKPMLAVHAMPSHITGTGIEQQDQTACVPAPVTCQLCHQSLMSMEALQQHCFQKHGSYAEYRKRLFYEAMETGHQPLKPWVKRSMIQNYSFFMSHSVPNGNKNDWDKGTWEKAVPRKMQACVFCCQRDYLENRFELYLFKKPTSTLSKTEYYFHRSGNQDPANDFRNDEAEHSNKNELLMCDGCLCLGPASKINELLSVEAYARLQPHIPKEELYASSVRHPEDRNMHWLLHARRIAKDHDMADKKSPFCAGIGSKNAISFACWECAENLCREYPQMPPLALANLNWLGRELPSFQDLTLGTKLLLGKGRPVLRQIFLGQGAANESYKGLIGNTILVSQAQVQTEQILPSINKLLDTLVIVFCKSVDEVRKCKALTVNRSQYIECLQLRKKVCPAFFDVNVAVAELGQLPENGVPEAFVEHAIGLPEAKFLGRQDGPGDLPMQQQTDADMISDSDEDQGEPFEGELSEDNQDERQQPQSQVMIGIDTFQDPRPVQMFEAMKRKLELLQQELPKLGHDEPSGNVWDDVTAAVRQIGQEETCRRIVVDVQDTVRKLLKNTGKLDDLAAGLMDVSDGVRVDALAVPSTGVLSAFDPNTFPSCFVEFFYGDAVPGLPNRPNPNLTYQQLFSALMQREEMEYSGPNDKVAYTARQVSRFDTPEFASVFGDLLRRMKTLQQVRSSFQRPGFERDLKVIASAKAEDFLAAHSMDASQNIQNILASEKTPATVQTALRHMLFSTTSVPLTEGYKTRLRHFGHGMNICFGPMTAFSTHNYTDTYHPLMQQMCDNPDLDLTQPEPAMPTLQRMHELVASYPMCTAKFFMLMEELNFRHLYGVDSMYLGQFRLRRTLGHFNVEDDYASSGVPGIPGFVLALLEALEAQGRGFQHGHRKTIAKPAFANINLKEILLRDGVDLATVMSLENQQLAQKAETIQYESATLPGQQLQVKLPEEPFSKKQQKQTKFDGMLEPDQETRRPLIEIVPEEPLKHIAKERQEAEENQRIAANPYREIPLTGCELSTLPVYRLPPYMNMLKNKNLNVSNCHEY